MWAENVDKFPEDEFSLIFVYNWFRHRLIRIEDQNFKIQNDGSDKKRNKSAYTHLKGQTDS